MTYSKIFLTITLLLIFTVPTMADWIQVKNTNYEVLHSHGLSSILLDDTSINRRDDSIYYAVSYYKGSTGGTVIIVQSKGNTAGIVKEYEYWDYTSSVSEYNKAAKNAMQLLVATGMNIIDVYKDMANNSNDLKQKYNHPAYTDKTAKNFKDITPDSPLYAVNEQAWSIVNAQNSVSGVVKNTTKHIIKTNLNNPSTQGLIINSFAKILMH